MGNAKSSEPGSSTNGDDLSRTEKRSAKKAEKNGAIKSDKLNLTNAQKEILRFCMANSKEDLGQRILMRVMDKRDDFRNYNESLMKEDRKQLGAELREFLASLVESVNDADEMEQLSRRFGEGHAHLRSLGFKPDFFVGIADAMTTECVFLDSATHGATDTLMAWSQLTSMVFSLVRDGYYAELRRLRRISSANSAKESSGDEQASNKDEDAISSKSGTEEKESSVARDSSVADEPAPQFLAPPTAY